MATTNVSKGLLKLLILDVANSRGMYALNVQLDFSLMILENVK